MRLFGRQRENIDTSFPEDFPFERIARFHRHPHATPDIKRQLRARVSPAIRHIDAVDKYIDDWGYLNGVTFEKVPAIDYLSDFNLDVHALARFVTPSSAILECIYIPSSSSDPDNFLYRYQPFQMDPPMEYVFSGGFEGTSNLTTFIYACLSAYRTPMRHSIHGFWYSPDACRMEPQHLQSDAMMIAAMMDMKRLYGEPTKRQVRALANAMSFAFPHDFKPNTLGELVYWYLRYFLYDPTFRDVSSCAFTAMGLLYVEESLVFSFDECMPDAAFGLEDRISDVSSIGRLLDACEALEAMGLIWEWCHDSHVITDAGIRELRRFVDDSIELPASSGIEHLRRERIRAALRWYCDKTAIDEMFSAYESGVPLADLLA